MAEVRQVFSHPGILVAAGLLAVVSTVGGLSFWSTQRVTDAAAEASAGRQSCLQVASAGEWKAAEGWMDLLPFRMLGGAIPHALLVVSDGNQKRLFNWSYWQGRFLGDLPATDDPMRWPAIYCRPGDTLFEPMSDADTIAFDLREQHWRIERAYLPNVSGGDEDDIFIFAEEPDFGPVPAATSLGRKERFYWSVHIELDAKLARQWMEGAASGPDQVVYRDNEGELETLLSCHPVTTNNQRSCQNRFIRNGMAYYFRHVPMAEADWRNLQNALEAKVLSFVK